MWTDSVSVHVPLLLCSSSFVECGYGASVVSVVPNRLYSGGTFPNVLLCYVYSVSSMRKKSPYVRRPIISLVEGDAGYAQIDTLYSNRSLRYVTMTQLT